MKKIIVISFLIFVFSTSVVIASTARSEAESVAFGTDNVQVHSSAETEVNGKKIKVESDQPGSIELEMKDDQVKIKTSKNITPTIFITKFQTLFISDDEIRPTFSQTEPIEPVIKIIQLPKKVFISLKNFLNRILGILKVGS